MYVWKPSSERMYWSDSDETMTFSGSPRVSVVNYRAARGNKLKMSHDEGTRGGQGLRRTYVYQPTSVQPRVDPAHGVLNRRQLAVLVPAPVPSEHDELAIGCRLQRMGECAR